MRLVNREEVLTLTRANLHLSCASSSESVDTEFLSEMLRRLAGIYCPCSPATLKRSLLEALEQVVPISEEFLDQLDATLNALHAGGDLLELARVTTGDPRTRGTWVFAASPSFVVLPSGTVRIYGLTAEETLPLPEILRLRVRAQGTGRLLEPIAGETLREQLLDAGFREQSIGSWLRLPPASSAGEYLEAMNSSLNAAGSSGDIEGLRIFDPPIDSARYKDSWLVPKKQTGRYTGRRPQAYGADIWGYVEVEDGCPKKFLDFPRPGSVHRGCDEAWRLQLALCSSAGKPKTYRLRQQGSGFAIDLFFPLPLWAERRLEVVGRRLDTRQSLSSFWLPNQVQAAECAFLTNSLWMQKASF